MRNSFKTLIFVTSLLCFLPLAVSAQIVNAVSLSVSPQNPKPNSTVVASVKSTSVNLDSATISWFVNNTLQQSGQGMRLFTFSAGDVGERSTVHVIVQAQSGFAFEQNKSILPGEINLLWQSNSYTPPLYKGKSLLTRGSAVSVVAYPNVGAVSVENLVFTWKLDGVVLGARSGQGKSVLFVEGSLLGRPLVVDVSVLSVSGIPVGSGSVAITTTVPRIVVYEQDPLLGILFNNGLQNHFLRESKEISLYAVPYFFSNNKNISYVWRADRKKAGATGNSLVVQGASGVHTIQVSAESNNIFESTQTSIKLTTP